MEESIGELCCEAEYDDNCMEFEILPMMIVAVEAEDGGACMRAISER